MAERIVMPKAGMAMASGTIIRWLKEKGEHVAYGEPLLEIETDKTTMEVEALNEGYLIATLYGPGDEVPVITTIGWIGEKDEAPPAEEEPAAENSGSQSTYDAAKKPEKAARPQPAEIVQGVCIPATPKARRLAKELGVDLAAVYTGVPIVAADVEKAAPREPAATPLARRIAEQKNIPLSGITGSGRTGKIFSADLEKGASKTCAPTNTRTALSGMRTTIARRMLESHTQIPPVTLNTEADVTFLSEFRKKINEQGGIKISFNDLVVYASAKALADFPEINVSFNEDSIIAREEINIGIAVAIDEGLIVPVVHNADKLRLSQLAAEAKELAEKARTGKLLPDDYTGGTFTVSNLGMFGITSFTPIINLPEAAILGACAITDRLALDGGTVCSRKWMGLSLTFDHRCIDGALGARFLARIRELLENPAALVEI